MENEPHTESTTQHLLVDPKKQNRQRVIQTCLSCHRAKRKCDRKKPCGQCLKRQTTANCIYEAISPADLMAMESEDVSLLEENEILRSRVADLEAAVAQYREQIRDANGTNKRKRKLSQLDGANSEASAQDKSGIYYGRSLYLGGPAAPDFLQRLMAMVPNEQRDMLMAFSGASNNEDLPSELDSFTIPIFYPNVGGAKEMLAMLRNMGEDVADEKLTSFLNIVDAVFHYAPTPWIMQRFERCFDPEKEPPPQEIALVFMVLALGDLAGEGQEAQLLVTSSMQLLRTSNFLGNPSLDAIFTLCYLAIYLQYEGRLSEYWPLLGLVIRLAQSMGLHRDPSLILNIDFEEAEIRRRLFWTIAAQETALSIMFGRPNGIGFNDVALPMDISDHQMCEDGVPPSETTNRELVNEISFNRFTWTLGVITREILDQAFVQDDPDQEPRSKEIEKRIWKWYGQLPTVFKLDLRAAIPTANDPGKDNYVQSLLLHIITNHNILVLFRKQLLTLAAPYARKPCYEAAFAVIDGWKILQDNFPKMAQVAWMQWFRAFHAALICLVAVRSVDGAQSQFRGRALDAWKICLQIFARIKNQNRSILGCWRALDRLDKVLQKESSEKVRKRRFSSKKVLRDSSQQLFIAKPSAELESVPTSSTNHSGPDYRNEGLPDANPAGMPSHHELGTIPENQAMTDESPKSSTNGGNMPDPFSFGATTEMVNGFDLPVWDMALFDMNTANWPSWLTNENSPTFS